jgi:hypothetical protein
LGVGKFEPIYHLTNLPITNSQNWSLTLNFHFTLLPGDGIGPEVVAEAVRVLDVIASKHGHTFKYTERLMGGCSIDKYGSSLNLRTRFFSARSVARNGTIPPRRIDPSAACSLFAKDWACSPICAPSKCIQC